MADGGSSKSLNVQLSATGGSQAAGEVEKLRAAIASLSGKTVKVSVNVDGLPGTLAGLAAVGAVAKATTRGFDDLGRASARASEGLRSHADASERASSSAGNLGDSTDRASDSFRSLDSDAARASKSVRSHASSVGDASDEADRAGNSFAQLGAGASSASRFMSDASGETSRVSKDLVPFSGNADRAGSSLARMGESGGKGLMEMAQGADGVFRTIDAVGKIVGPAADGIGSVGKSGLNLTSELGSLSSVAGLAGPAVAGLGLAVAYSAAGMAVMGAATAGIGIGAGLGDIMSSAPLMNQATKGVEGFTGEFKKMSSATADAGMSGMKGLAAEAKELGSTAAGIGVRQLPLALAEANTLGGELNSTLKSLEPAMGPSVQAGGALGSAMLSAVSASTPYISAFAGAVEQAAPALGKEAQSVVQAATSLGTAGVKTLAALEPAIQATADVIGGASDFFLGGQGIKSNLTETPQPDGSTSTNASSWNKAGTIATKTAEGALGGGIIGTVIPGIGTAVGAGVGAVAGLASGIYQASTGNESGAAQKHVPNQGGGFFQEQYAGAANPDLGEKAAPGQATFQPGSHFGSTFNPEKPTDDVGAIPSKDNLKPTDRAAELSHGTPAPASSPSDRTPDQNGVQVPGTRDPNQVMQSRVGSSMGGGDLSGLQQQLGGVNSAMQQTGQTAGTFGSQFSSAMSQTQSAAMGGTSAVKQSMQGAAQGVQSAQPLMQNAAQSAFSPLTQQAQQAQPAAALQAPMQAATAQVQSQAPAMASAGSDAGAAVGEGMGQGITKEITNTLTIVKKWVTNIIDTAADMLGIASPSKVFYSFGQFTAQGFTGGLQSAAPASAGAVQSMMQDSVGAAQSTMSGAGGSIMGGFGSDLQSSMQGAFDPLTGQMQSGLQGAFDPLTGQMQSGVKGAFDPLAGQMQTAAGSATDGARSQFAAKAGELNPTTEGKGYFNTTSGGKPLVEAQKDRIGEAQKNAGTDAKGNSLYDKRADNLVGAKGMTGNSAADLLKRQDDHNARRTDILGRASTNKDAAWASIHPELNTKGMNQTDKANAWRNSAEYNKDTGGTYDPTRSLSGPNTPEKADTLKAAQKDQYNKTPEGTYNNLGGLPVTGAGLESALSRAADFGQRIGDALGLGQAKGIQQTSADVASAAKQSIEKAEKESNKQAGIASPSKVWAGIGVNIGLGTVAGINSGVSGAGGGIATGLGGAISDASSAIQGVASDRGLMVGFSWATSMVDGVASVMKKSDFQNAAFPTIEGDQAKNALAQLGLLGPAGSGASIWKDAMVTMGGGSATTTQPVAPIYLTLQLDGQPFRQLVLNSEDNLVNAIVDSTGLQVG